MKSMTLQTQQVPAGLRLARVPSVTASSVADDWATGCDKRVESGAVSPRASGGCLGRMWLAAGLCAVEGPESSATPGVSPTAARSRSVTAQSSADRCPAKRHLTLSTINQSFLTSK
jgi:hypothetical protein